MRIGILKTGTAPTKLAETQGDYDARMRWLLGGDGFDYVTYDVENGELPASIDEAEGWIITGSRHGAYEDHAWIPPLEDFIRRLAAAKRPLVGICFGHQIVAQALGGRVEKAGQGWIAGPHDYVLANGERFAANAWHQDQVIAAPPGAETMASSQACEFAVLHYPGFGLTVQPHPEFTGEYFSGLLAEKGHVLPDDVRANAEALAETQKDDPYTVRLLRHFMRNRTVLLPAD